MRTYARIQDGRVAELLATNADIKALFHSSLFWVEAVGPQTIEAGWIFDGSGFAPPVAAPEPEGQPVSIAELQRQVAWLSTQLAALTQQ